MKTIMINFTRNISKLKLTKLKCVTGLCNESIIYYKFIPFERIGLQ